MGGFLSGVCPCPVVAPSNPSFSRTARKISSSASPTLAPCLMEWCGVRKAFSPAPRARRAPRSPGACVDRRRTLTSHSHAISTYQCADRRPIGAPINNRGRRSPFNHKCANTAVGENLQGMAHANRRDSLQSTLETRYRRTIHRLSKNYHGRGVAESLDPHNFRERVTVAQM